jgi:putative folate metabolism gamma-glutamate ligase
MHIRTIRTHKITTTDRDLLDILDTYVTSFDAHSILAVTSKIVAICQGRVVPVGAVDKQTLIEEEADYFLSPEENRYRVTLTIKDNVLIPSAGIDESNSDHHYVLWPEDTQAMANIIRDYLCRRFDLHQAGVIITDSKTTPLRWGVTGVTIAHSGFGALNSYVGRADLFGRPLRMTRVHVADALAAAAVLLMGEGDEQTPLAVISDVPFVEFQPRNPTSEELQGLHIALEDDLYAPLLKSVNWQASRATRETR